MLNNRKITRKCALFGKAVRTSSVILMLSLISASCGMKKRENIARTETFAESEATEAAIIAENEVFNTDGQAEFCDEESFDDTSARYITDGESFIRLKTRTVLQERIGMPFGCEAVSLSIALAYYGYDIEAETLFEQYMSSGVAGEANPFYSYVGDPRDMTGYGCYAPCAVRCVNSYLESCDSELRARDISGSTTEEINALLWEGKPVVIWGTLDMRESDVLEIWYFGGNPVYWYSLSHCVVLSGISSDGRYFVADPMKGNVLYEISDVERAYTQIYSQALVIE